MEKNEYILEGVFQKFETNNTPSRIPEVKDYIYPSGMNTTDHVKLYESMFEGHVKLNTSMALYYLQK